MSHVSLFFHVHLIACVKRQSRLSLRALIAEFKIMLVTFLLLGSVDDKVTL